MTRFEKKLAEPSPSSPSFPIYDSEEILCYCGKSSMRYKESPTTTEWTYQKRGWEYNPASPTDFICDQGSPKKCTTELTADWIRLVSRVEPSRFLLCIANEFYIQVYDPAWKIEPATDLDSTAEYVSVSWSLITNQSHYELTDMQKDYLSDALREFLWRLDIENTRYTEET